jgi:peptidyl-prolyl cis-trans isomerase C
MPRWYQEPLLHFLVAGAAIFALTSAIDEGDGPEQGAAGPGQAPAPIVVDSARRETLRASLEAELGRPPSDEEVVRAVDGWVADEALYREAVALGLDRGDLIVRRRLIQNLRFVLAGRQTPPTPDEATLRAHYEAHREAFERPGRYTLEHVFLSEGDSEVLGFRAAAALDALRRGDDPATVGDPFLHGRRFERQTVEALAQRLGQPFVAELPGLPAGEWAGPVLSTFGVHLVRIVDVVPGGVAPFEEVRAQVEAAWLDAEQARLDEAELREVIGRYPVVRE